MCGVLQAALEHVAQAGQAGILRAELAQELNMSSVNVHYYLKPLLRMRFVSVTSVRYKNGDGQQVSNSAVLHLRKCSPEASHESHVV
jgi:B-block binding subunit of TFIIIC